MNRWTQRRQHSWTSFACATDNALYRNGRCALGKVTAVTSEIQVRHLWQVADPLWHVNVLLSMRLNQRSHVNGMRGDSVTAGLHDPDWSWSPSNTYRHDITSQGACPVHWTCRKSDSLRHSSTVLHLPIAANSKTGTGHRENKVCEKFLTKLLISWQKTRKTLSDPDHSIKRSRGWTDSIKQLGKRQVL